MAKTKSTAPTTADALTLDGTLLLYGDVKPVIAATHGDHAILAGPDNYAFAANAPLIPITVDEFALAALHYPIVFFGPERRAFVVAGLTADRNLFVGADGAYRAGAYIPAYLRRYPFVFARDADDRLRILCLDQASDRVGSVADNDAMPLFVGEQPTDLTRHAMTFCQDMEAAETRTALLVTMLDEAGIFTPRQAHRDTADGPTLLLDYLAVDAAKLDALDADAFGKLRQAGALTAIYAHLLSEANWTVLDV